ncbi:alpha/beta fold hydrolase [Catelliglobosispora koreensis]|uniref:alpha/beta fold hydrolase n=1 Tax=Catelliglobosispora koreensis TaxID=129052 RepID=UPI00039C4A44|nr:alpha/beta hydrolase [Catelliglobosispora koreensis]
MRMDIAGPVHYVDHGGPQDAPKVVYVHGLGGSHHNWNALAPLLTEHVRAHAVDLAGFGLTPAAGRKTTVAANAVLLGRFLERLGDGPFLLIGNSMGGLISTYVANSHPSLVRGLVLVDPTLPLAERLQIDPAVRNRFLINGLPLIGEWALQRRYLRVPAKVRIAEVLQRCCADPSRIPASMVDEMVALEEELTLQRGHAAAQLAASRSIVYGLARPSTYWRRMAAIKQPVLLLHGTHDRLVPISSARAAAKRLPHWTYTELDAGHIPQMETPELVAEEIVRWLKNTKELSNA